MSKTIAASRFDQSSGENGRRSYVLPLDAEASRAQLGGKAAALTELQRAGFRVPGGFVVTPQAARDSLGAEKRRRLASGQLEGVRALEAVQDAIRKGLQAMEASPEARFAVRSSALDEDEAAHSLAGQLESYLFVAPDDVADRVADVWRSAFSEHVRAYRREHNLTDAALPAVLVQCMVPAERAGVAFSADPVSGRRGVAVVSAVRGIGAALVDGDAEGDTYRIGRDGAIREREIVDPQPVLSDDEVRRVAELARRVERHFERPQDIEWAIHEGTLWLLQARPITTLTGTSDPDGSVRLWDNSNIAESYGGVTTPLTFSFARRSYESVYRAFFRVLGVPESKIRAHDGAFRSMVGLVRGRIYYNLMSWYQALALLPGYRFNRAFMEDMMGVSERMPDELLPEHEAASATEKARDVFALTRSVIRLVRAHRKLPQRIERFRAHLDSVLQPPGPGLDRMRLGELANYYRHLEAELLERWDVPLACDFLAMVFSGLSRRLLSRWADDEDGQLHSRLIAGVGEIVSTEPARRVRQMAECARSDDALVVLLADGSLAEIGAALPDYPELQAQYEEYLDRFSDRCLDELKLESKTLRDDSLILWRAVAGLARRLQTEDVPPPGAVEKRLRREAETELAEALSGHPVRRRLTRWALRHARRRVADRENLRFERTRVFGRVRRIFLEMGRRLYAENELETPRDVFYLEVEELLGFVEGTATTTDLRGLVGVRKGEYEGHRDEAPPGRFETRGAVHAGNDLTENRPLTEQEEGTVRTGCGCSPGEVRGPVRVVRDPRNATLEGSEILVADRTDPGWVLLFSACRGLVVERGSLLSHAAIVAREMGLPAVVGVEDATRWLADGDHVALDGAAGTVQKVGD